MFKAAPAGFVIDEQWQQMPSEPLLGILTKLENTGEFEVAVGRLRIGDYQIDNRFLVERKTLTDLVQAIISGRLFSQAARLVKEHTLRPLVILEGTTNGLRKGLMSWEAIQGALVTVSVFYDIPILRSRCLEETVKTFTYLVDQARACKSGSIRRHALRPKGKEALQHHILQSLPGIGPKRADSLLENFQTIEAVVNAEESALVDIPGIGADTAQKIRWTVREEPKAYNAF